VDENVWANGMDEGLQSIANESADMTTVASTDGAYRYVSPASERLFGWKPAQILGRHQDEFVHPDDLPQLRAARGSARGVFTVTYRFRCLDDSYHWTETTFRIVEAGGTAFTVSTVRDISERQDSAVQMQLQALTDPLTGVANRTVLMDRLRHALKRLDRGHGMLAVLFLDLDRFKVINDSLGHQTGDAVLQAIAERLQHFTRASDTLARLGGDEFVVVAEDVIDHFAAVELGNRIAELSRRPIRVGEEEFVCTVSVGIAITSDPRHSPESLLQEADLALYQAKDRGRDRAEVFGESLRTKAVGRLGTERMLRRAIDERRVRVHYQPIIDIRSGRPVSAEALVRVFDPDLGILRPEAFLEVADETGLLVAMDEWVLADAVRQAARWHTRFDDAGFSGVSINITARHLADAGLADEIVDVLDARGLPRDRLQMEVTERVLIEASNSAMRGLRALRDAGLQVGLDDFGTGYSSLAYLRGFPLDFVKIDRSFIQALDFTTKEDAIVAAIVGLSHALGLTVVAEGVETKTQLDSLHSLGCDRAQGFLFATPDEPQAIDEIIMARAGGG
jgi:diguanylate cyclase (GGDEF)-like protein/PAS domain S-box-containing protein